MMAMTVKVQKRIEVSKSHASIYDLTGGDVANVYKRGRRNMNKDFGESIFIGLFRRYFGIKTREANTFNTV